MGFTMVRDVEARFQGDGMGDSVTFDLRDLSEIALTVTAPIHVEPLTRGIRLAALDGFRVSLAFEKPPDDDDPVKVKLRLHYQS